MENEEKDKSKLQSRKFLVWLCWLVVSVVSLAITIIVFFVTKDKTADMMSYIFDFLKTVLGWFFAVSMMYLGMNAGQKVGFAFADALTSSKAQEEEKTVNDN